MTTSRRILLATAALLALAPALVRAQCLITGSTTYCGATTDLCGPADAISTEWQGPGVVAINGNCITANAPGTYTLFAYVPSSGWQQCSITIAQVSAPQASITGPSSGCAGTPLHLCGPGGFGYQWNGPGGFSATTACIDATVAGDYTLVVTDPSSGCGSAPVTQSVAFTDCAPPPSANCPRTAMWWSRACHGSVAGFDAASWAAVVACLEAHSPALGQDGDAGAVCRALRMHPGSLHDRAVRQVVAVLANSCAGSLTPPPAVGNVGLDMATPLAMPGMSGTVGDWVASASVRLTQLSHTHGRAANASYRDIIRVGWEINHGLGIGATCAADSGTSLGERDRMVDRDEPLEAELSDDGESLTSLDLGANPAHGTARMSLAVSEPTSELVVGVYDLTGRLVRELAHGPFDAGVFTLEWDGRDAHGMPSPNGVYFVQTRIGGVRSQSRLTLLH